MQRIARKLRYLALTLRERVLDRLGMEIDYDYRSGKELIRRKGDKQRDPPPEPPWVFFPGQPVEWGGWGRSI